MDVPSVLVERLLPPLMTTAPMTRPVLALAVPVLPLAVLKQWMKTSVTLKKMPRQVDLDLDLVDLEARRYCLLISCVRQSGLLFASWEIITARRRQLPE